MEELIRILFKRWKSIIIVCIIAAIGSVITALLLPSIYSSSVTFLTISPHMMDRGNLFDVESSRKVTYLFGGKEDNNRILALSQSRDLEGHLIEKFKLYEHYEIDKDDPEKDYWVTETLRDNFKIVKTNKGMLVAEVFDKNSQLAADMANEAVAHLDVLNKNLITEKKQGILQLYEKKAQEKKQIVDELTDSLKRVILNNPKDTVTANVINNILEKSVEDYTDMYTLVDQQSSALNQSYSTLYLIESAVPATRKSKPIRWLIVVSAVLIAFVVMVFVAVILEKMKEFREGS